ncbi:MAG: cupin domain-containing protein [Negativicutes bacterium]|nr:cupin domain-containing protein [Negativicutes bacterium]
MFVHNDSKTYVNPVPGVRRKTLAVGEKGLIGEFRLEEGTVLPPHQHPHEQIGYLVSGELVFTIGDKEYTARPGDSWAISGNVPHAVKVLKSAVAVEVFVPIREDYLD